MGGKLPRAGGKIPQGILPPGGQAAQGGKINCYTGSAWVVKVHFVEYKFSRRHFEICVVVFFQKKVLTVHEIRLHYCFLEK